MKKPVIKYDSYILLYTLYKKFSFKTTTKHNKLLKIHKWLKKRNRRMDVYVALEARDAFVQDFFPLEEKRVNS